MGGSKPKKSGAPPTRRSTRYGKQHMDLGPYLYQGARARIDRSNTTGDGVQAAVAAASVEDGAEVCAAGWIAAQRVRASRLKSGGSTPRSPNAGGPNAGGAGATAQMIQDLNVVVVGVLDREKVLKQRLKAMDERENGRTLNLHKLCGALATCYKDLKDAHEKLQDEVRLQV